MREDEHGMGSLGDDTVIPQNGNAGGALQIPPEILKAVMEGRSIQDVVKQLPPEVIAAQISPELLGKLAEKHGFRLDPLDAEEDEDDEYEAEAYDEGYEGGYGRDQSQYEGSAAPGGGRRREPTPVRPPQNARRGSMPQTIPDEPPHYDFQEPPLRVPPQRAAGQGQRQPQPQPQGRAQPAARQQLQPVRRPAPVAPRRARVEDDEAAPGESNTDMLNDTGVAFGGMLSGMPGVEVGITFEGGGRFVRVAAYFPETPNYEHEDISLMRGSVARLGDIMALVFTEAMNRSADEATELEEEDYEDDE